MGLLQTCKLRFPRSHISMLTMGLFFPLTLAVFLPGLKRICCSSRSPFYGDFCCCESQRFFSTYFSAYGLHLLPIDLHRCQQGEDL